MRFNQTVFVAMAGMGILTASAAGQAEFYTGQRITNPIGTATFDVITANGYPLADYREAGLRIHINDISFMCGCCSFRPSRMGYYYPNGGNPSRIEITREDAQDFGRVEFAVSSGFASCPTIYIWISAYNGNQLIEHFNADVQTGTFIGMEGIFDRVLVGAYTSGAVRDQRIETNTNAIAIDDVSYEGAGTPSLRIDVSGSCPGSVTVEWRNATPSRTAGLLFARNQGSFTITGGPCAGTQLGLGTNQLQLVRQFNTGANGSGQMSGNAGVGACGGFLQVVVADGSPCDTSNVGQIP